MPKTGILVLVRTAQQVRSPTARVRDFHSRERAMKTTGKSDRDEKESERNED